MDRTRSATIGVCVGLMPLGVLAGLVTSAAPAAATESCGAGGFWFDGTEPAPAPFVVGTMATMIHRPIQLCTNPGFGKEPDSSIWINIARTDLSGLDYMQVGYGKHYGQTTAQYFSQYFCRTCANPVTVSGGNVDGMAHSYKVGYNTSLHREQTFIDGALVQTSAWDPVTKWGGQWSSGFNAETHRYGDDVPGTPSAKASFADMSRQVGGNWQSIPFTYPASSTSPRYDESYFQNTELRVWTK